jgi:hypothetical protein
MNLKKSNEYLFVLLTIICIYIVSVRLRSAHPRKIAPSLIFISSEGSSPRRETGPAESSGLPLGTKYLIKKHK